MKVQGKEKNYPFLILRDYTVGYMHRYPEILQILDRHPGLIEEIWFGYSPRTMEDARKEVESLKPFVQECKKRNIRFAIQHGITLGHGEISGFSAVGESGKVQLAALPENAWAQAQDGHRMWGVLCPRSSAAWKHIYDLTAYILTELDVESFWIDDEFRLGFYKSPCFCTRCIKAFNKQFGHTFTRKKLIHHLYEKIDPVIRGEWSDFQ